MTGCLAAVLALAIVADGRLDEPEWAAARWEDGVAVLADAENVYVGVRGGAATVDLAPGGTAFSYYRFTLGPGEKEASAAYFSEGGVIQPDPYAPLWTHASASSGGKRSFEAAIPLSAFYMTRTADWKTRWLVRRGTGKFASADGFPKRAAADDVCIRSALAEISDIRDGRFVGQLKMDVFSAVAGRFSVRTSAGAESREVDMKAGGNRVTIGCSYPARGRQTTLIGLKRISDGRKLGRRYPVLVDFQAIGVKLSVPQYRNNFYPGQDASRVVGRVAVAGGAAATVSIEGPGFRRQEVKVGGEGAFSFDTRGFAVGDARLTVTSGSDVRTVRIRRLPDTGRRMVWIEGGHLVVNGRPVLRRNLYADKWMCGEVFLEKYGGEESSFRKTPEFERYVDVQPDRLVPGLEDREARRDVRPCDEYFRKVDEVIEKNRNTDFGYYYLIDEPECRHISPVYLKYAYDYIAEKDPYHPLLTASRGGKTYIDCVDWAETHPYLDCYNAEDGTRTYNTPPNEMGRFLDAFEAADRPDKVIGFLPTCFAYRWQSIRHDYPTLDEYVLHTWAALIRGAKSLWPYAGHDLGDRPALYHGCRYTFQQAEAYEKFLLLGKHTAYPRANDVDRATWTLGGETLDVSVDYKTMKTTIRAPRSCEKGLEPFASVAARVAQEERERRGRDNQLRGRYDAVAFSANFSLRGHYKLIDGTRDMLAGYSGWITNAFLEAAFTRFAPRFSKLRLWGTGEGVERAVVSVRTHGEWRRLVPKSVRRDRGLVELDFGEPVSTVKLHVDFPGRFNQRNEFELYEIELPRCEGADGAAPSRRPPAAEDAGVLWRLDGKDSACTTNWSGTIWMTERPDEVRATASGGFLATGHLTRYVALDPKCRWLVLDIAGFHDRPEKGYRAWSAHLNDIRYLGGTVTDPQPGLYAFRLPEGIAKKETVFRFYTYGLDTEFNSIALMEDPANRVELDCEGGVIRVRARFAEPCEDVSAEFLIAPSTGNLLPFPVNGTHGIELKALDAERRVWGADIPVKTCAAAKAFQVYVKVTALGGGLTRPVFGNFDCPFRAEIGH